MNAAFPAECVSPNRIGNSRFACRRAFLAASLAGAITVASVAGAAAQEADPTLLHDANGLKVRWHFQLGLNAVAETNLFWDLAEFAAPTSGFESDTQWLESYAKPGLSVQKSIGEATTLTGKVTGVMSYTLGTDAFDSRDTGRVTLEEAHLRLSTAFDNGVTTEFSAGGQEVSFGTGMLISKGGSSGFERGSLKLGPHRAWQLAAVARVSGNGVTGTAFYLDANEMTSNELGNRLAGVDVRLDGKTGGYVGSTYARVVGSRAPYPRAAPGGVGPPAVEPGARNGLNALNVYARTNAFAGALKNLFLTADLAYEWNPRIDLRAWAGRAQAGYAFAGARGAPTLTYGLQAFSGDDPNTTRLERFDPLYYDGSPSAWATGSKSAMMFINSNVRAHNVAFRFAPTRKDAVTLRYAHVTAINRYTFLSAGFSLARPGQGITAVAGLDPVWTGGFVNVVFNF
ncbi:MAG: alginate export family protein [Acidobacteriota bacterium]|nr:alginate export family protein [Acidobacteriota bacterium]